MPNYLVLDYETKSRAELKRCGIFEYAHDPSTRILCAAWKVIYPGEVRKTKGAQKNFNPLIEYLIDPGYQIIAHNAAFERTITKVLLGIDVPIERWICTAAMAATHALPRKLEGACDALKLPIRKDPRGRLLIQRHCKPRRPSKNNPSEWNDDPQGLADLLSYCMTDVDAEWELFKALPPMPPTERKIWMLDQRANSEGVRVDRPLVQAAIKMIGEESETLKARALEITGGISASRRDAALKWLSENGAPLPNLQAKTITDAITAKMVTGRALEFLRLRSALTKTSLQKYPAFEIRTRTDSRVREFQVYHGAAPGRFAGAGIQTQNFPRGSVKDIDALCRDILTGDLDWMRMLYFPLDALVSALRGCFLADPGQTLYCADYNAIEARAVFWLARHESGLQAFRDGRDLYREMAARIYRVALKDVTPEQREVGKRVLLGAGYGLGHKKFAETCKLFGTPVTPELAETAIKTYREIHAPVVRLWRNMEDAAIMAVRKPVKISINRVKWFRKDRFLYCELPSGRRNAYCDPEIQFEKTPWGEKRPRLYFWGVNPRTKKWSREGTYGGALTENCLAKGVRVITNTGIKPITKVQKSDLVFDGQEWVPHDGVIYRGKKETGKWLGIRVTHEHLIFDGKWFRTVIGLDEFASLECLRSARASVSLLFKKLLAGEDRSRNLDATAVNSLLVKLVPFCEQEWTDVVNVHIKKQEQNGQSRKDMSRSSQIRNSGLRGFIDTPALFPDAITPAMSHLLITAGEESGFIRDGGKIEKHFCDMRKRFRNGMIFPWKWIAATIRVIMNPAIFGWLPKKKTATIGKTPSGWNTEERKSGSPNSMKITVRIGKALMRFLGIFNRANPPNRLWRATGKREMVYDLKNCGPNNRFLILTNEGPVLVHNCTQGTARDFMCDAMLRIEPAEYQNLFSVHDEILAQSASGDLGEFKRLMAKGEPWAEGLPIKVSGWEGPRYRKG